MVVVETRDAVQQKKAQCVPVLPRLKNAGQELSIALRGLECQARQQCFVISSSVIVGFATYGSRNLF